MSNLETQSLMALTGLVRVNAPGLATLLAGPAAAIAVAALGRTLLNDAQATVTDVVNAAHNADPATRLAIIAADQACQLRLRESGTTLPAVQADVAKALPTTAVTFGDQSNKDTADARQRQISLHDITNSILAYATTAAFVLVLVVLVFFGMHVDATVKDLLFTLLGVLATGWATVIGYYFGSSVGSSQKTQAINDALLRQPATSQGAP